MKRRNARRVVPLGALLSALLLGACTAGAPPPGPIDIIRGIFDPNYDYRRAGDRPLVDERACSSGDLTCTHEGSTVCCAPSEHCCVGSAGPYCCDRGYAQRPDHGWD